MGSSQLVRRYRRRGSRLHTLAECRAEANYTLWLRFDDGLEGHVYLGDLVRSGTYCAIRDEEVFSRVAIDPVSNALTWGSGIRLDCEVLYRDLAHRTRAGLH